MSLPHARPGWTGSIKPFMPAAVIDLGIIERHRQFKNWREANAKRPKVDDEEEIEVCNRHNASIGVKIVKEKETLKK